MDGRVSERFHLKGLHVLLVDGDPFGAGLLVQMLHGLGAESIRISETAQAARHEIETRDFALCIVDALLPDMPGTDLVRWIRRLPDPKRGVPILALSAQCNLGDVTGLRDAGAHLVMKKPVSPAALHERIAWVVQRQRDFIDCDSYAGPDRRFKFIGPPGGVPRRATDLSIELGAACEPNMSQDEIDTLMRPTRMTVAD